METELVVQDRQITPMGLIARAQEKNASIEQMQQLFDLQCRFDENEARKSYYHALVAFKSEATTVSKDGMVGYKDRNGNVVGYTHATLGNVINTITPVLAKHGLCLTWELSQDGGDVSVTCRLTHELGYSTQVTMAAGKDASGKKNNIQQIASTTTYLQRYTALAITGIATQDGDDDGQASVAPQKQAPAPQQRETSAPAESKGMETMPMQRFNENFPAWETIILAGKKTPEAMIAYLGTKGMALTPAQRDAITNIRMEGAA